MRKAVISGSVSVRLLFCWMILAGILASCEDDRSTSGWLWEDSMTIGQYLKVHQTEYPKFFRLLEKGKMLSPLYAYNPRGEGYTLFLPTDEAVDEFIKQSLKYHTIEELLKDTVFVYYLTRYHTLNRKVHTDEFPDGGLTDSTITRERLSVGFYPEGDLQRILINNEAPVIQPNLGMTNGYIHVISKVLQPVTISGYDWLQQQKEYSILAKAMELAGIRSKLTWGKYTILAEKDTVYYSKGIRNIQDLINRIATPGVPLTSSYNSFYLFTAYHILSGELYLNDFSWGEKKYLTLANRTINIRSGQDIYLNSGVETYGMTISSTGDTTQIDYILPVWESSNRMTKTGPVHSLTEVLHYEALPK
jgi:hypothetical protein